MHKKDVTDVTSDNASRRNNNVTLIRFRSLHELQLCIRLFHDPLDSLLLAFELPGHVVSAEAAVLHLVEPYSISLHFRKKAVLDYFFSSSLSF